MSNQSRRGRIYFAAPLFNEMERRFNRELVEFIEPFFEVFLPQRDGGLLMRFVKEGATLEMAETHVFLSDIDAMRESDAIVAVLDGACVDEGVAFEIGYMFALGKVCVGLQTDFRRALPTGNNPMIGRALDRICASSEELVSYLRDMRLPEFKSGIETQLDSRMNKGPLDQTRNAQPRSDALKGRGV
jgi:nucleoside 2-deoxyribosyltransferase